MSNALSRALLPMLVAVLLAFLPSSAQAFPWMVHHGYTQCAQCHLDPSGGGALTSYGRAQGKFLLRSRYDKKGGSEAGREGKFLYGLVPLPENDAVIAQADVRGLLIPEPGNVRMIMMQADLRGGLQLGNFVAYGSLGPVSEGGEGAWLTSNTGGWNLTARDYWVGYRAGRHFLIRGGRIPLPFGIRTEDHTLYVREATRTNTNDEQQTGLSVTYSSRKVRAELMGIAGNFQVSPDAYRERGYSGYFSYTISKTFEVGASSLFATAQQDLVTYEPRTRQAHGVFLRVAPVQPLAIMAESDLLLSNDNGTSSTGLAASGVVDYEPIQGLHVQGIGQYCNSNFGSGDSPAWTAGGALQWFLAPRVDIRVDAFQGVLHCTNGVTPSPMGLVQAHFFL